MYYRRKILLALFEVFDKSLTAKKLQKLLFLFTRTQESKAYDFIPYYYGCFSFQANQDVQTLSKYGHLDIEESSEGRFIKLRPNETLYLNQLNMFEQQALWDLKKQFNDITQNELIAYTYRKYPYYAIKSRIAKTLLSAEEIEKVQQQKRTFNESCLFSIGYEGISLEKYINKLIINDVHLLCDVRKNAYSQKYGFSKSQLIKACEGVGIKYIHISDLGIESDKRRQLNSQKDYDILFTDYENSILINNNDALLHLKQLLETESRVAITCFEKDPSQCHRTRIAKKLMSFKKIKYSFKNI